MRLYDTMEPWTFHLSAESHVTSLTRNPFILPCGWELRPRPGVCPARSVLLLVTNALKHAFDHVGSDPDVNPPWILIALNREGATITLTVADNGRGLPQYFSWRQTKSLGLTLVRMLGEHQLSGTYTVAASRGAAFTLSFPIDSRRTA